MNTTIKTIICAFLLSTASIPAFADAHADLNAMTSEEYNCLNSADRDKAAATAIAEIGVGGSGGTGNKVGPSPGLKGAQQSALFHPRGCSSLAS